MKKAIFIFIIFLYCSFNTFSQSIFKTDYEYQADISVFVVAYEYQADLCVYLVDYEYQADEDGLWFMVKYDYQADKKIF